MVAVGRNVWYTIIKNMRKNKYAISLLNANTLAVTLQPEYACTPKENKPELFETETNIFNDSIPHVWVNRYHHLHSTAKRRPPLESQGNFEPDWRGGTFQKFFIIFMHKALIDTF